MYFDHRANAVHIIVIIEVSVGKVEAISTLPDFFNRHLPAQRIGEDGKLILRFLEIERHYRKPDRERWYIAFCVSSPLI